VSFKVTLCSRLHLLCAVGGTTNKIHFSRSGEYKNHYRRLSEWWKYPVQSLPYKADGSTMAVVHRACLPPPAVICCRLNRHSNVIVISTLIMAHKHVAVVVNYLQLIFVRQIFQQLAVENAVRHGSFPERIALHVYSQLPSPDVPSQHLITESY
jgi:hypothetical protein